ncbi:uncharacterized protein LOC122809152 isoform X2 [Protopterus annectens]|uniref:uncharacterized protein LOC122809152 isoform X2 n=1 Tax=Protopterus annectens TaxID=7888 RepID=UPI001CF9B6F0|nr:uncharacterized protein LOC122809152 isoform X2 [Protopterus annectens]
MFSMHVVRAQTLFFSAVFISVFDNVNTECKMDVVCVLQGEPVHLKVDNKTALQQADSVVWNIKSSAGLHKPVAEEHYGKLHIPAVYQNKLKYNTSDKSLMFTSVQTDDAAIYTVKLCNKVFCSSSYCESTKVIVQASDETDSEHSCNKENRVTALSANSQGSKVPTEAFLFVLMAACTCLQHMADL